MNTTPLSLGECSVLGDGSYVCTTQHLSQSLGNCSVIVTIGTFPGDDAAIYSWSPFAAIYAYTSRQRRYKTGLVVLFLLRSRGEGVNVGYPQIMVLCLRHYPVTIFSGIPIIICKRFSRIEGQHIIPIQKKNPSLTLPPMQDVDRMPYFRIGKHPPY